MVVSIIVTNYNGKEFLNRCLRSVFGTKFPEFEVILVDDCSSDGSADLACRQLGLDPRLKIVRNSQRVGLAQARNIGVRFSKGDVVCFLDNDTQVDPMWLSELVKPLASDQSVAACQSKILSMNNPNVVLSMGGEVDRFGDTCSRGMGEPNTDQNDAVAPIFFCEGCALAVRRRALEEARGFDPNFWIYHDDVDFSWRLRLLGYQTVVVPKSIVYHRQRGSTSSSRAAEILALSERNRLAMLLKNYSIKTLIKVLPVTLLFLCARYLMNQIRMRHHRLLGEAVRVFLGSMHDIRNLWRERIFVQRYVRRIPDADVRSSMLANSIEVAKLVWFLRYRRFIPGHLFLAHVARMRR